MKKNVEIKKLGINGEGIGYIDRKIVFVPGALPQEEVIVEIIKQTRTYSEGKLLQVVKPSKDRVTPERNNGFHQSGTAVSNLRNGGVKSSGILTKPFQTAMIRTTAVRRFKAFCIVTSCLSMNAAIRKRNCLICRFTNAARRIRSP